MENEKYFTTRQAAELYHLSEQTLRNAIAKKQLKASEITTSRSPKGFIYRIAESDLKEWINSRTARKTIIPNVTNLTVDDLAEEILKRVKNAYDEGYKAGKKDAKAEFMSALKGVK